MNDILSKAAAAQALLQPRGFALPDADAGDIVRAVQGLEAAVGSSVAAADPFALPEPFQRAMTRLASAEDAGPAATDAGWSIQALGAGGIGSEEWVRRCLDAIDTRAPGRLAWVGMRAEAALAEARVLDTERARGQVRGPLHGVPVGLKDMFDHTGRSAGWGSPMRAGAPSATQDATIVARLKAAGAVVLGFQHMAEFAMSPTGLNAHLGPGRNPWNVEHACGGSSSGAGMSVGSGQVPLAIGSDTGGSIRLPAAMCGVTGFKPSQYRVSLPGAMPLSPGMDCLGPLAGSAVECGWAFAAMAGADPRDPSCLDLAAPQPTWMRPPARPFKVAMPVLETGPALSAPMQEAYREARKALEDAGVACIEVPVPDMALYAHFGSVVLAAESAAIHRAWLKRPDHQYGRQVLRRLSRGLLVSGFDYFDALRLRPKLLEEFLGVHLRDADAILLPVTPDEAPLVADTIGDDEAALEARFTHLSIWTRGINYLGLPALSVPAGKGPNGLPLGLQFVGRPLGDARVLALGKRFQECTDWHLRRP
jgi:aspartyl-tRNA(Asn)/glutamyl-tRNA(Gln) amidotransferase subunit A